ncbi:putative transcription factor MYB-related family [Helianthus annuus]|nr:putative transcription factor MYB-related family [Helianthus annuus]
MAPKKWWTSKEEEALKAGVKEYKAGNWKDILKDPRFASILANRTNIDLKDKWRNMNGGGCVSGGSRKASTSRPPVKRIDRKYKYNTMIYESLRYIEDPNGTDVDTMMNFLESKYELHSSFRKSFIAALEALEVKGYLKKVNDRYKVKKGRSSGAKTSRQEDVRTNTVDTREHPASVAIRVALAETYEYKVTKLCEDKNKLEELLDESVAMLMLAEGLYEQCKKYGSVTYSAV